MSLHIINPFIYGCNVEVVFENIGKYNITSYYNSLRTINQLYIECYYDGIYKFYYIVDGIRTICNTMLYLIHTDGELYNYFIIQDSYFQKQWLKQSIGVGNYYALIHYLDNFDVPNFTDITDYVLSMNNDNSQSNYDLAAVYYKFSQYYYKRFRSRDNLSDIYYNNYIKYLQIAQYIDNVVF